MGSVAYAALVLAVVSTLAACFRRAAPRQSTPWESMRAESPALVAAQFTPLRKLTTSAISSSSKGAGTPRAALAGLDIFRKLCVSLAANPLPPPALREGPGADVAPLPMGPWQAAQPLSSKMYRPGPAKFRSAAGCFPPVPVSDWRAGDGIPAPPAGTGRRGVHFG